MRRYVYIFANNCHGYSIWHICPASPWLSVKNYILSCHLCTVELFPFVYWFVLFMSIVGLFHSFVELMTIAVLEKKKIGMWRQRQLYVIPFQVVRKCRLCGAVIKLTTWSMLACACASVKPDLMLVWQTLHGFVLLFDFSVWLFNVSTGLNTINFAVLTSFSLPAIMLMLVQCVRNVFAKAIAENDINCLSLFA